MIIQIEHMETRLTGDFTALDGYIRTEERLKTNDRSWEI